MVRPQTKKNKSTFTAKQRVINTREITPTQPTISRDDVKKKLKSFKVP